MMGSINLRGDQKPKSGRGPISLVTAVVLKKIKCGLGYISRILNSGNNGRVKMKYVLPIQEIRVLRNKAETI